MVLGNELVVTVTAADGETTQVYSVTLVVAASTDTSLAVFTVNGQLSYKIEDFEGRDGKPGRKVKLDINNAQVDKPVAPVAADLPF